MNAWLVAALVLMAALVPCVGVCVACPPPDGLVALELAGIVSALILLLLAEGLQRQPFVDLALVLAATAFAGSLGFARLLERRV